MSKFLAGAMLVAGLCHVSHAQQPRLELVKEGQPVSAIIVADNAPKWTIQAVTWLNEYLDKVSGATLTVVVEGDEIPDGTLISVGHTQMAADAGIDHANLMYDGCKLIVKDNVLYLLGRDTNIEIKKQPLAGARGTCRAVLTFLEDFCGVRWFLPGPQGEYVPKSADISVPADLDKTFVPEFAYADGRFPYDYGYLANGGGTPGAIINNYRKAILSISGGHSYYAAVPGSGEYSPEGGSLFDEHPEYFALIAGRRTSEGNHLCTSNPEVRKLLLRHIQKQFDAGWEWITIGQEDGYRRCECSECEKLDNFRWPLASGGRWEDFQETGLKESRCERLFLTHKWVIDEAAKSHPDKKVMLMCYAPTAWPSKVIDYFGDNVICEVMNQSPDYMDAWKGKSSGMACYFYLFWNGCPMGFNVNVTPKEIAEKVRYLRGYGVTGIYHGAESNFGLVGPTIYVFGKMMGDSSLDYKVLVREYCDGVFGKASDSMQQFFEILYARLEQVIPLRTEDFSGRNTTLPRWMDTTSMFLAQYPPSILQRLDLLLKNAEAEADTERARGWVKLSREHFDFVRLLTEALISYRAWQVDNSRENWQQLKQHVDAFDAFRMRIITYDKAYTDLWFPGHAYFCQFLTANCERDSKTYFVSWESRKPAVLERGIKGISIGYGTSYYFSFVQEPLTLDFSRFPGDTRE